MMTVARAGEIELNSTELDSDMVCLLTAHIGFKLLHSHRYWDQGTILFDYQREPPRTKGNLLGPWERHS